MDFHLFHHEKQKYLKHEHGYRGGQSLTSDYLPVFADFSVHFHPLSVQPPPLLVLDVFAHARAHVRSDGVTS